MMCNNKRADKLKRESAFWERLPSGWLRRFIDTNVVFYHPNRHAFTYHLGYDGLRRFLAEKGCNVESTVLDVACGVGHDLMYLVRTGAKFVGLDVSRPGLAQLRVKIPAVQGDALTLPFRDDSFDFVVASLFFHHIVDEGFSAYLREMQRVLKPGGWLVILDFSVFFPVLWLTRLLKFLIRPLRGDLQHERAFNPLKLLDDMKGEGLGEVGVRGLSYIHNRFYLFFSRIVSRYQGPLCDHRLFKYCAFLTLYWGQKPRAVQLSRAQQRS